MPLYQFFCHSCFEPNEGMMSLEEKEEYDKKRKPNIKCPNCGEADKKKFEMIICPPKTLKTHKGGGTR